jgi:hypothetical protein
MFNKLIKVFNLKAVRIRPGEDGTGAKDKYLAPSYSEGIIPAEAKEYLVPSNPRLQELKKNYASLDWPVVAHSFWSESTLKTGEFSLQYFRGDNVYLWQYRSVSSNAELKYLLYSYYLDKHDRMNLLGVLEEDKLFGIYTFDFNGKFLISRDLLDSISEINFLEKTLNISSSTGMNILDIGAGYGRLAHRMTKAVKSIGKFYCVDAVPESTFISEFYVKFRGLEKASVIALNEVKNKVAPGEVQLACNIHSFSECTIGAIRWWLDFLVEKKIKYFFLVPNPTPEGKLLSTEANGTHEDYYNEIIKRGYKLLSKEAKFMDPALQSLLHHTPVYYYLFELNT